MGEGLAGGAKKRGKMLHLAGMKVQGIFETLEAPTPAPDDPYEAAVGMLNKYFEYKPNNSFERHTCGSLCKEIRKQ